MTMAKDNEDMVDSTVSPLKNNGEKTTYAPGQHPNSLKNLEAGRINQVKCEIQTVGRERPWRGQNVLGRLATK